METGRKQMYEADRNTDRWKDGQEYCRDIQINTERNGWKGDKTGIKSNT